MKALFAFSALLAAAAAFAQPDAEIQPRPPQEEHAAEQPAPEAIAPAPETIPHEQPAPELQPRPARAQESDQSPDVQPVQIPAAEISDAQQGDAETRHAQPSSAAPAPAEKLTPEEERIKEMLRKNPFAPTGSSGSGGALGEETPQAAAPAGLQLRGISRVDGKWTFFVFDAAVKTAYRIELGKPADERTPYSIDFFDEETNSVSISNTLGSYTLTLKTPDAPSGKAVGAAPFPSAQEGKAKTSANAARAARTANARTTGARR